MFQFRRPQIFFVICAMAEQHLPPGLELDAGWFRSGLVGPDQSSDVAAEAKGGYIGSNDGAALAVSKVG